MRCNARTAFCFLLYDRKIPTLGERALLARSEHSAPSSRLPSNIRTVRLHELSRDHAKGIVVTFSAEVVVSELNLTNQRTTAAAITGE